MRSPPLKEVEVPVPVVQYAAHDTGCTNSFGNAVPCLQEGEARRKREADEEPAAEAEAAAPVVAAAPVLPYGLPLGYAGHLGYGYGLPYHYPVASTVAVKAVEPTVTEVEVPQYKYVPEVKTVELPPACQNAWGFAVPCI